MDELLHKKYENLTTNELNNKLVFLNNKSILVKKELEKKIKELENIYIEILEITELVNERQNTDS